MKRKMIYLLMPLFAMVAVLSSCSDELDIKQDFDFELTSMPVPTLVKKGETIEIRFNLDRTGSFSGTKYYLSYFQADGKGIVSDDHISSYNPNDWYLLIDNAFSVYYTSRSEGLQTLDFAVKDSFGKTSKLSFRFTDSI